MEFKDRDTLIEDVITGIKEKLGDDVDLSEGEPLRNIIEAVMQELDYQNWQLGQIYESGFIDTAYGEDLTQLVKILGIERRPPTYAKGLVKFYRETPATLDYYISSGTLVETIPDEEGNILQYETIQNATLLTGQTEIFVEVQAVEPGEESNIIANKIITINNPPLGIESVVNAESISGGEKEETDEELKLRAMSVLDTAGQGTVNALHSKISNLTGIKSVKILDMERGIGTVDILVLGDTIPMPSLKKEEIENEAQDTKAGGIDILVYEPTIITLNINITLTLEEGILINDVSATINEAITDYFKSLDIGEPFIKNQLSKSILNKTEGKVLDLTINNPSTNVNINIKEIIALGTITLN